MKHLAEKFAPVGSVLAAAGCPACFPALTGLASVLGITAFAAYEAELLIVTQILVVVSMLFAWRSYRRTRYKPSLALALTSGFLVFFSWYIWWQDIIIYSAFAGLIISAFWNIWLEKRCGRCEAKGDASPTTLI
jgi:mercuric ion transport protein